MWYDIFTSGLTNVQYCSYLMFVCCCFFHIQLSGYCSNDREQTNTDYYWTTFSICKWMNHSDDLLDKMYIVYWWSHWENPSHLCSGLFLNSATTLLTHMQKFSNSNSTDIHKTPWPFKEQHTRRQVCMQHLKGPAVCHAYSQNFLLPALCHNNWRADLSHSC